MLLLGEITLVISILNRTLEQVLFRALSFFGRRTKGQNSF